MEHCLILSRRRTQKREVESVASLRDRLPIFRDFAMVTTVGANRIRPVLYSHGISPMLRPCYYHYCPQTASQATDATLCNVFYTNQLYSLPET